MGDIKIFDVKVEMHFLRNYSLFFFLKKNIMVENIKKKIPKIFDELEHDSGR